MSSAAAFGSSSTKSLKGVQRPAAFAIVGFCFCDFRTVNYSGSCAEQVTDFVQSMLVLVLPLTLHFKSAVRSLIYTRKNNGPNIDPWGTPAKIFPQ